MAAASYSDFLTSKLLVVPNAGRDVPAERINPHLFPFQRDLVRWSLRKGRTACFADTGLGKTRVQLAWAEHAAERALILAPLAVAQQTVREGERMGIAVTYARRQEQAAERGITITNYEMLHAFDPSRFGAVALDEASILKNFTGVTKQKLIERCRNVPMRLALSATPAPNDVVELLNHADFLGIMPPREMLTTFFTPRGVENSHAGQYRLKKHAEYPFYRWMASWAVSLGRPSDLNSSYSDAGYDLPPLMIEPIFVESDYRPTDRLFVDRLKGVRETATVRRGTVAERAQAAAAQVQAEPEEQWLIWAGLNEEAAAMTAAIPGAVEVRGTDDPDTKANRLMDFAAGRTRVLVTKLTVAGHGLNFQNCARMAFVGIGHSYEQYYQGLRRCWRYGQTRPVKAWVVITDAERSVYENIIRKEQEAANTTRRLIEQIQESTGGDWQGMAGSSSYQPGERIRLPQWISQGEAKRDEQPCQ